ncbi:MAG TPA: hypothetical protein VFE51_20180 [Verrucomicrobiae bacterium]|nr:hypothetical protein [Verrucomicrobiae bacterium]
MKKPAWLFLVVALSCVCSNVGRADDLFRLFWRGTYYTKNSTGHIVAVSFSESAIVNQVAQSAGMDPSQLVFVYRPNKRDAAVVQNNGAFVASVFQMQDTFTDVTNPSGSVTVRHALLTDQSHDTALGSFFGLELRTLNSSGGLVGDSLTGTVLYSKSDLGAVFSAQVSTGGRLVDTTNAP